MTTPLPSRIRSTVIEDNPRPWQMQTALLRVLDYADSLGGPAGAALVETVAQSLGIVEPPAVGGAR